MSCGKSAWHDEQVADAHEEHKNRLEALGFYSIANKIDDISSMIRYFEADITSLPRASWARMDQIKKLLKDLS